MLDSDFIEFQPTLVTVPESTLERVLIALEAGWESASDEHAEAITQYQERRPHRVKWYAEQVELITAAIHEVQRALGRPPNSPFSSNALPTPRRGTH